jgi:rhodanese-related sulfurtransferase
VRLTIYSFLAALLLAATFLTGCNSTEKATAATKPEAKKEAPAQAPDDTRRISIADAKTELEGGKAVVIDVRGEPSFKAGHIKGAKLIPLNEIAAKSDELPKDKLIILYCSCPAEQSSLAAAHALKAKNISTTAALVGGYPAWKQAGYPVEEQQ